MVALKVSRVGVTGTTLTTPSLKISRVGATGTAAILLNPIAAQTVEPGVMVTLTAVLTGGGSADSYSWRFVSGDTVTLGAVGAVATFTSPSVTTPTKAPRQATTTIGVTATVSGVTSPERQVTVTTLPQLRWTLNATRAFIGVTRTRLP
jgi:hypothetical protein